MLDMEAIEKHSKAVARLDTEFVKYNINSFSEKEKRFLLYIVSKIEYDTNTVFIEIPEIISKKNRKNKFGIKWSDSLNDLDKFMEGLSKLQYVFATDVIHNVKILKGRINWFQSIVPIYKKGVKGYEIEFSEKMMPFIYNLKEYVRVNSMYISNISGKYGIELYLKLLAVYEKQKKHRDLVIYTVEPDKLKNLLGIDDKVAYQEYKRFKSKVIEPAIKNINDCSSIYVWYKQYGKPVHTLEFYISENYNNGESKAEPKKKELAELTKYQYDAYMHLINYKIHPGIAFYRIIPLLPQGDLKNFPDLFVKFSIADFDKKTKLPAKYKPGGFVNWFYHQKIYDISNNTGISVRERIINTIKKYPALTIRISEKPKKIKEIYGEELQLFK